MGEYFFEILISIVVSAIIGLILIFARKNRAKRIAAASPPSSFLMTIEEHFGIAGRGGVALGTIAEGSLCVGNKLFLHAGDKTLAVQVGELRSGDEATVDKKLASASQGMRVAIMLSGLEEFQLRNGDILSHTADPS